jgi:hypothetical protein
MGTSGTGHSRCPSQVPDPFRHRGRHPAMAGKSKKTGFWFQEGCSKILRTDPGSLLTASYRKKGGVFGIAPRGLRERRLPFLVHRVISLRCGFRRCRLRRRLGMADNDRAADGLSALAPRLPIVQMIGQRQRHVVAQFGFGKFLPGAEQDAPVAAIAQFWIELSARRRRRGEVG